MKREGGKREKGREWGTLTLVIFQLLLLTRFCSHCVVERIFEIFLLHSLALPKYNIILIIRFQRDRERVEKFCEKLSTLAVCNFAIFPTRSLLSLCLLLAVFHFSSFTFEFFLKVFQVTSHELREKFFAWEREEDQQSSTNRTQYSMWIILFVVYSHSIRRRRAEKAIIYNQKKSQFRHKLICRIRIVLYIGDTIFQHYFPFVFLSHPHTRLSLVCCVCAKSENSKTYNFPPQNVVKLFLCCCLLVRRDVKMWKANIRCFLCSFSLSHGKWDAEFEFWTYCHISYHYAAYIFTPTHTPPSALKLSESFHAQQLFASLRPHLSTRRYN